LISANACKSAFAPDFWETAADGR